jgi:DedD protein
MHRTASLIPGCKEVQIGLMMAYSITLSDQNSGQGLIPKGRGMDEQLKKRLLGGVVLVSLMVIFLPMMLEDESPLDKNFPKDVIPERTLDQGGFEAKTLTLPAPRPDEPYVQPNIDPPPVFIPPDNQEDLAESVPSGQSPEPQQSVQQPLPEVKAPSQQKLDETKKVASTAPAGDSWVVQVASLSLKEKADDLIKDLRSYGHRFYLDFRHSQCG